MNCNLSGVGEKNWFLIATIQASLTDVLYRELGEVPKYQGVIGNDVVLLINWS